jgi:MFS family permease
MSTKKVLILIVLAQFLCSSSWFAVNAVMGEISQKMGAPDTFLSDATMTIQLGFIIGTLTFAMLSMADRFSPSKVFFGSSIMVSIFNLILIYPTLSLSYMLLSRFVVGFFLAGIYPVGMKIAADYFEKGLGKSLGFLVGALVLGTALPHLIKGFSYDVPWSYVIYTTSLLTILGGSGLIILVPDGPYKKIGQGIKFNSLLDGFKIEAFKEAAFGYFGHMWELYTFWAFVPIILQAYLEKNGVPYNDISLYSFIVIASGSVGCMVSGYLSQYYSAKRLASTFLFLSCMCCLLSPILFLMESAWLVILLLIFWGIAVVADSPLFSTLVAQNSPPESRGTAITLVNCIGFTITIISIQFLHFAKSYVDPQYIYMLLAIGPIWGLVNLLKIESH